MLRSFPGVLRAFPGAPPFFPGARVDDSIRVDSAQPGCCDRRCLAAVAAAPRPVRSRRKSALQAEGWGPGWDQEERVGRYAAVPADHPLDELEHGRRVAAGEQDREPGEDGGEAEVRPV